MLSRKKIEGKEILPNYYARQAIEQIFGFAKHNNSILPLRVHGEQSIKGYIMLVFLALILFVTMRCQLKVSMDKVLLILRGLKAKIFDEEIIIQEPNKKIKNIMEAMDIIMPTVLGI